MIRAKKKKHEMAREQRGKYIYILFTMEQQQEKTNVINNRQTITKF
jgi:transcription antitermination factor NusG